MPANRFRQNLKYSSVSRDVKTRPQVDCHMTRIVQTLSAQLPIRGLILIALTVLLAGCLHLDLGTVLALKKVDPYTVDLINSRAAVMLPPDVEYDEHVRITVRITHEETVLEEQEFLLEVLEDGEALPGINLQNLSYHPLIVRLAPEDYARANDLQTRLGQLDKNHGWVEPGSETVGSGDAKKQDSGIDRTIPDDDSAHGDVTIGWTFRLGSDARARYCQGRAKIRLTAWVKLNDAPEYKRVIHGLPLKRVYGRKGMQELCAGDH